MALGRHIPINMDQVFPAGAYAVGGVEQVIDFEASTPGQRVQAHDRDSGLPCGRSRSSTPIPMRGEGRRGQDRGPYRARSSAGAGRVAVSGGVLRGSDGDGYVDTSGSRPRLAWSFRATAVRAATAKTQAPGAASTLHRLEQGG